MKRSWLWFRILLLVALFVLVGLVPALTVIPASSVPPLGDMQVSEGTIAFRSKGRRSGLLTVIEKNNGDKEEFSCREALEGVHDCIDRRYAGESGKIHWFWVKLPLGGGYRFAAQIVVNGEVVRDRATALEQIENARVSLRFGLAPLVFIGCVIGCFFMIVPKGKAVVAGGEDPLTRSR